MPIPAGMGSSTGASAPAKRSENGCRVRMAVGIELAHGACEEVSGVGDESQAHAGTADAHSYGHSVRDWVVRAVVLRQEIRPPWLCGFTVSQRP